MCAITHGFLYTKGKVFYASEPKSTEFAVEMTLTKTPWVHRCIHMVAYRHHNCRNKMFQRKTVFGNLKIVATSAAAWLLRCVASVTKTDDPYLFGAICIVSCDMCHGLGSQKCNKRFAPNESIINPHILALWHKLRDSFRSESVCLSACVSVCLCVPCL
jgi:hypothetical protein